MNQAKYELINDKLATAVVKAKTGRSKAGDGTTARAFLEVAAIYLDEITEAIGTVNTLSEAIAVAVLRYLNRTITKEMDEENKHIADTVEGMLNEQAVTIRTKIAQLESINRNLVDNAKEKFEKGEIPVSVANEMATLPQEVQQDLAEQEDVKLSQVKEIKEGFKGKTKCKYDDSKICHTKLIAKQQEHLQTNGPCVGCCRICDHDKGCRYRCENMSENIPKRHSEEKSNLGIELCAYDQKFICPMSEIVEKHKKNRNIAECPGCCHLCGYVESCEFVCAKFLDDKKLTEKELEKVSFNFQDIKETLKWVKRQTAETKVKDKEAAVRMKVLNEALKKYLKEMVVVDHVE